MVLFSVASYAVLMAGWLHSYRHALTNASDNYVMRVFKGRVMLHLFSSLLAFGKLVDPKKLQAGKDATMAQEAAAVAATLSPRRGSICFIGSSTFTYWRRLKEDLMPLPVYNAAFGGSQAHQLLPVIDNLVVKHKPSTICYFCGTNGTLLFFSHQASIQPPVLVTSRLKHLLSKIGNPVTHTL